MNEYFLLCYLATGALAGFMSGLLGIGGGVIIVPALAAIFLKNADITSKLNMQMAIGTSLAIMTMTLATSIYVHHRRAAVKWQLVKTIAPGLILGVLLGAIIVHFITSRYLSIFFGLFLLSIGSLLLFKRSGKSALPPLPKTFSKQVMLLWSSLIGVLSSLLGVGGGTMWVPFFLYCQLPMREAVGTSVACGTIAAFIATISFVVVGMFTVDKIPWSTSYIYWPAFAGTVATSILFVPMGAVLAHKLSNELLKRIFAVFLLFIAIDMLFFSK